MARPTSNKIVKMQERLTKMQSELTKMKSELATMGHNPRGADVELAKSMNQAAKHLGAAEAEVRNGNESLNPAARILRSRGK